MLRRRRVKDEAMPSRKEIIVKHAIVWIDAKEARVFEVDGASLAQSLVTAPGPHIHRHAKEQEVRVRNHPDDQHRFFEEVARALHGKAEILIVGPSKAKLHFLRFVQQRDRALEARIVGIETADHPTDPQLVAYLRQYFQEPRPDQERSEQ
jgi:stalled ribosome rescue protein Dom34